MWCIAEVTLRMVQYRPKYIYHRFLNLLTPEATFILHYQLIGCKDNFKWGQFTETPMWFIKKYSYSRHCEHIQMLLSTFLQKNRLLVRYLTPLFAWAVLQYRFLICCCDCHASHHVVLGIERILILDLIFLNRPTDGYSGRNCQMLTTIKSMFFYIGWHF
jgi:hypothetical protein